MTIMTAPPFSPPRPSAEELQALRETVARVAAARGPVLPFGVGPIDHLLAAGGLDGAGLHEVRSEEHTSELQSLMRISYAVFCLKKKKIRVRNEPSKTQRHQHNTTQKKTHTIHPLITTSNHALRT